MAVFSTNQNRQLYVVTKESTDLSGEPTKENIGSIEPVIIEKGNSKQLYFKYMGPGGLIRSDLIDVDKICYAKYTGARKLRRYLRKAIITLDPDVNKGNLIVGQDYIVKILIHNYLAPGDTNVAIKYGAVHAVAGMDAAKFYEALAKSLTMNFSREVQPLLIFNPTADGVEVIEVEQPHITGFMAKEPVNFEIIATTVRWQGDDVVWAKSDKLKLEDTSKVVGNGANIADLEYFCMGERGDQYRDWVAAPNKLPVKYMVNPDEEYNVLDLHYFFSDTGVNSYKSEKDITIVEAGTTVLSSIVELFMAAKIIVIDSRELMPQ